MRTMLVVPGRSQRYPGDDYHSVARFRKAFVESDPAGLAHHRRLVLGVAREHAMHSPHGRELACRPQHRRERNHGETGAFTRDAQSRRPRRRVAEDGRQLERVGNGVRGGGNGVAAVACGGVRVACTIAP